MGTIYDSEISISEGSRDELVVLVRELLQGQSSLENLVGQLQTENASLRAENTALRAQVMELEAQVRKDSHNSSKPPSSDGLAKKPKPKSLRQAGSKPSGGQPGHPGSTLRMSETPDRVIVHSPVVCGNCGADLKEAPHLGDERRQVFEMPEPKLDVTEHRLGHIVCASCGTQSAGESPANCTGCMWRQRTD